MKVVTGGTGRTVFMESPKNSNSQIVQIPHQVMVHEKMESLSSFIPPELKLNPFMHCFKCGKEGNAICPTQLLNICTDKIFVMYL